MRHFVCIIILSVYSVSQTAPKSAQDIVEKLLPEGNISRLEVPKVSERQDAIKQLQEAKRTARGERVQQIAFLLGVLNVDYSRNRDYLLWVLRGCDVPEIKNGCNDMTGEYLVYLFRHGHPEILAPLLDASVKSYNAAGAEGLGAFFAELIAKSPNKFLDAVRSFQILTQKKMCYFAGSGDGGGMAPSDLKKVRERLSAMNDEVARRCLYQVEQANRQK
jgi:hypothetical protein